MSTGDSKTTSVAPAQLSFLTIYNPTFSHGEDSLEDQILFYSSKSSRERRNHHIGLSQIAAANHEEENERLRQVGLAQGMIDFAKNFSDGQPVDTIETEKSRIVLHELEKDWWILAAVDLTRLPTTNTRTTEYSSREVAPPGLLLQQLLQAHSIFLLHQATSLADLYLSIPREEFCSRLDKFWSRFIRNWDVLLHGNPAVGIYNGIKLAAGGELGIGVGEEELGSAEREVLEGFIGRTAGLVDLLVSRFGDGPEDETQSHTFSTPKQQPTSPWLGADREPLPSDGVIFSGVGAISRKSTATISQWMEWIFKYGESAYGVGENPSSRTRRKRRTLAKQTDRKSSRRSSTSISTSERRPPPSTDLRRQAMQNRARPTGIPPPLVTVVEQSLQKATSDASSVDSQDVPVESESASALAEDGSMFDPQKMKKYLTLGYGTSWSFSVPTASKSNPQPTPQEQKHSSHESNERLEEDTTPMISEHDQSTEVEDNSLTEIIPVPEESDEETHTYTQRIEPSLGRFLVGLTGDVNSDSRPPSPKEPSDEAQQSPEYGENDRIALRTLSIEMGKPQSPVTPTSQHPEQRESQHADLINYNIHQKVQIAVYVHQPFIFTFIFTLHTPSLTYPTFYRNIDHQLGPLQRPLLNSTSPEKAVERIASSINDKDASRSFPSLGFPPEPIYDLVYDPTKLAIRSSIPNIPIPGNPAAEGLSNTTAPHYASGSWLTLGIPMSTSQTSQTSSSIPPTTRINRIQALNIHTHILNMYASTRRLPHEAERSVKTNRDFWVLWMKIPPHISETLSPTLDVEARVEELGNACKEAFLVRTVSGDAGRNSGSIMAAGRQRTTSAGRWLVMDRVVSGSSDGSAREGNTTVMEGVGGSFDARRYVEALIRLNR